MRNKPNETKRQAQKNSWKTHLVPTRPPHLATRGRHAHHRRLRASRTIRLQRRTPHPGTTRSRNAVGCRRRRAGCSSRTSRGENPSRRRRRVLERSHPRARHGARNRRRARHRCRARRAIARETPGRLARTAACGFARARSRRVRCLEERREDPRRR